MSRKKIIKSPSLQLPSTAFLSKGTRRFPQSPAPLRRRVQLRGLSPPGVKEGLGGQEAIIRPLLALRRHLPRPVLISVPKYMGSYVSYFIVEIQALHIKFGHIYWNNTPARVRRGKLVIRLGGPTLFLLNGKSSRRCCQGLEVLQRTRKGLSWGRNLLEKHNIGKECEFWSQTGLGSNPSSGVTCGGIMEKWLTSLRPKFLQLNEMGDNNYLMVVLWELMHTSI